LSGIEIKVLAQYTEIDRAGARRPGFSFLY
jgi:hypothetical protein